MIVHHQKKRKKKREQWFIAQIAGRATLVDDKPKGSALGTRAEMGPGYHRGRDSLPSPALKSYVLGLCPTDFQVTENLSHSRPHLVAQQEREDFFPSVFQLQGRVVTCMVTDSYLDQSQLPGEEKH